MNQKVIPLQVRDEYILGAGGVIGAEGSGNDVALQMEFGARWEGLVKYVTFRDALGENPEVLMVTADMMELLKEEKIKAPPMLKPGRFPPPPPPCFPPRHGRLQPPPKGGADEEPPEKPVSCRVVYNVPVPKKAKAIAGEMMVTVHGYAVSEDGTQKEAATVGATAYFRVLPAKWAEPETEGFEPPTVAQQMQAQIERIQTDIVEAAKAADAKEAAQRSAEEAAKSALDAQGSAGKAAESVKMVDDAINAALDERKTETEGIRAAETARVYAEKERDTAEADRAAAELERADAERLRADAEAARVAAERKRVEAEAGREEAEEGRRTAIARVEETVDETLKELRDGKYDLAGTAKNLVGKHNEDAVAHPDLRLEVQEVRATAQAAERAAQQTSQAAAVAQAAADAALHALIDMEGRIDVVPYQFGAPAYTGEAQEPTWGGYDPEFMTMTGELSGVDAGDYTVTFTPKEGYHWAGGTTEAKEVTWSIQRAVIPLIPIPESSPEYTGSVQSPTWVGYDAGKMTIGGTTEATKAGRYYAAFTPGDNYRWGDGSVEAKMVAWSIGRATLPHVPYQANKMEYTGAEQSPVWVGYDSERMTIGGAVSGTNAGSYTVTFTPGSNYQWPDGTTEAKEVNWVIGRAELIAVPSQSGSLTYTGADLSPSWSGYDSAKMTLGGVTSGTNVGTYTATFTPTGNYQWDDGSVGAKSASWSIGKATISAVPAQSGSLTYTGKAQSPAWSNYDAAKLTIGGASSATNVGTYTATFTPTGNYQWSDGTTGAKSVNWSIGKAVISTVPRQSGSLTYTGSALSPSWSNYDTAKLTIGGTRSGINAGSYTATFTPTGNYQWSDGTTGAKNVSWAIGKAAGTLTLNKTSMTLSSTAKTGTIAVTRAGDGAISATSSNTGVATVSVSGNTVTVTGKSSGSVTITVKVAAGTNHTAPANKTCTVAVNLYNATLNSNTWERIREASDNGEAPNIWAVGDTKSIVLNGEMRNVKFSNLSIDVFIIGFNHNASREGDKRIHFQIGKIGGKLVSLCDSHYLDGPDDDIAWYNFAMWASQNEPGWDACDTRLKILGNEGTPTNPLAYSFMNVLPEDLRAVMKSVSKYTDNTGGMGDDERYISETEEYLFILSVFEYLGKTESVNAAEANYQEQYAYYKAGNSTRHYGCMYMTDRTVECWTRSSSKFDKYCYCLIDDDYENTITEEGYSQVRSLSPAFCV